MSPDILFLASRIGHRNGCTDLRIILIATHLPLLSTYLYLLVIFGHLASSVCPTVSFHLVVYGGTLWLMYVCCQHKILTYTSCPSIHSFILLLPVVLYSRLRYCKQGRRERVWAPVKKRFFTLLPRKVVQAKSLLEGLALICRVTWAWSWCETVYLRSR